MGEIDTLQKYIDACDEKRNNRHDKYEFIQQVFGVYDNEIENIHSGLDMYRWGHDGKTPDYDGDIIKIKEKLINYKDNLEMEEKKRKDELELARLGQNNINLSANANNSNNINISVTLEQAIKNIEQIPEEIMSKDEKDDLEDKLSGIDAAVKSGKKEKAKEKIAGVLKFLADKGADALIAMLPYLGQMAGMIQNI